MNTVSQSTQSKIAMENQDNSYFDGGYFAYIGYNILVAFVTTITLGIAFPWMCCLLQRWKAKHTVICGKRQYFDGTGVQLIGKFLLWSFLTIITFGIYGFWMTIAIKKWVCKHTHFVGEEDNNSYFDGGVLGFIGTNLLAAIVTLVPFVGGAWSKIIKLSWEKKHTVVDSRRLVFVGTIGNFFLKYLVWGILTFLTLGIFALFVPVKKLRLEAENTIDHEHTTKALMQQSEYRNTVQNTVSVHKNCNTEFEMENLKAGINDTTDEEALRAFADGGMRSAQYLYVIRYANEQYTEEPYSSMLKESAEAGYAPAMCLYALTHELEESYKNELLSKAADQGQSQAIRACMNYNGNQGLAESNLQIARPLMEKAVFLADVLENAGEELSGEEQDTIKKCILKIRKMESDTNISSLGTVGKVAIVVAVIVAVVVLLGAISSVLLFTARTVETVTPAPGIERIEDPYMEMAPEVQMSF